MAVDSVGLDVLYAQTKHNVDENGHPRIMIRENAEDYLIEEATAEHPPSGTVYLSIGKNGKRVTSLGVFEHWDDDCSRQYSRNKDPKAGKVIELVYLPLS